MILIVDDDAQVAGSLCRLFRAAGYPCHHVQSGAEGLAAIRSHPATTPLLVVLDQMMPGMTGTEMLLALRSDPAIQQTPVMFYAGEGSATQRDEAMTLGALTWLPKGGGHVPDTFKVVTGWYERVGGVRR